MTLWRSHLTFKAGGRRQKAVSMKKIYITTETQRNTEKRFCPNVCT
ncbi:MAG: hypothetical protein F6K41_15895 [Symploca sp. SIO3E6]|nr:hypothetical protein [Caldora sp. SIO3E6]